MEGSGFVSVQINTDPDLGEQKLTDPEHCLFHVGLCFSNFAEHFLLIFSCCCCCDPVVLGATIIDLIKVIHFNCLTNTI
jgi:hypothetical protein